LTSFTLLIRIISMKYILFLLFALPTLTFCQIVIEPSVNLSFIKISVEKEPNNNPITLEREHAHAYGIGIELSAKLLNRLSLGLSSEYNYLINRGDYCYEFSNSDGDYCLRNLKLSRWDNSVYFYYIPTDNVSIGLGGHAVFQPFHSGSYFGRYGRPYKSTELGLGTCIKFYFNKISCKLNYYRGFQGRKGLLYLLDPVQSFGIEVGVPITLKER